MPVTVPTLLLMENVGVGVPVTAQDNVVDWPAVMVELLAVKDVITGVTAAGLTVTVTGLVTVPELLVAVNI